MSFERYTALSSDGTLNEFKIFIEKGYTTKQIQELRKKYGKNELTKNQVTWWHILFRQFKSVFIYILIAAVLITFVLGEKFDSFFILFFVGVNVILGFFQEYKSEQTTKFLRKYTNKRATVVRDGAEETIDATELVPGDVVVIETGDIVAADLRLVQCNALMLDESTLTGESVSVRKTTEALSGEQKDVFKASNIAFSGTTVVEGKGLGIVVAVGKDTQFGKIAKLTTQAEETSVFERQINKFSKFILFLVLITLVIVFVVHVFFKNTLSLMELVIYSIALAVGVIPEAMPLVTTFALSIGAAKLAKKKVIVKRLSAIEDLGGIQILCTDKTGTITENKLSVSSLFTENEAKTLELGILAASSLDKKGTPNNSFDLAILEKIGVGYKELVKKHNRLFELPFNPARRRNSVLLESNGTRVLIVRGAVEAVMPHVVDMSADKNERLMQWVLQEGRQGRRVIAIAKKTIESMSYTVADEESQLSFVGLIAFEDPIKSTTNEALKKAKDLGIVTKIITGDSAEVAVAVGIKVGIAEKQSDVITGDEFLSLPKNKQKEVALKLNVFARMSPEQKYDLIKLLQENYEVGFLGEGINDGPALKAAGVSIVVDNASDVSREVADLILLKHDLKVIIDGIELGRKTYVNVTNYVKATLASNFGNFYAMAFVTLLIDYLPMLPVQILLVNLLSDFPMISIATDNVDRKDLLDPKNYAMKDLLFLATILGLVSTAFDFMMFGIFKNYGESGLQTYWFIGSILTELVLIYSIRTQGWFFKVRNLPSMSILVLTLVASLATVFIPFTTLGTEIFKFIVPAWDKLALVFAIVVGYLASTEIVKHVYYKYLNFSKQ
ncbi:cation-transporting P-type ATPase [candidate division WWE3 bacterium]|uniref:Cation-transporting P-type ATPase n=1 Tax=candidate division WWE3 bacterium TaxID=2053526 RepID=A0A7X9HI84_UNCKA|nr:cation-transporting P-type ATPase [candidate division WWE3 bacterium]